MIGKTNLTFVSKGEASNVNLIQKSYALGITGKIYKLEEINEKLFAFVYNDKKNTSYTVWSGSNVSMLSMLQKDDAPLSATHIIYADDRYYIAATDDSNKIYTTFDFKEYEEIVLPEDLEGWHIKGIFLDSKGNIVLMYRDNRSNIKICVNATLKDTSEWNSIQKPFTNYENSYQHESFMKKNMIFVDDTQVSLSGDYQNSEVDYLHQYIDGYFFKVAYPNNYDILIYRSPNGSSWTQYNYKISREDVARINGIFPINGKYAVLYEGRGVHYINIADEILKIGHLENEKVQVYDSVFTSSWIEYDGKTYIGTADGTIYEFQLDYEGILQRPDVTIIKTLAAKQALQQALQYTDDCIERMKQYVDQKILEKDLGGEEENLTEVES